MMGLKHECCEQGEYMHSRIDIELDLTGLESPLPMLKTKELLDSLVE